MQFVYSNDPQKNDLVQKDLDLIVNFILSRLKNIDSIVMIGGFAHGEGAVVYHNNQLLPVNDYDLYLISEKEIKQSFLEKLFQECNLLLQQSRQPYIKPKPEIISAFDFQKDFFVDGHFLKLEDLSFLPNTIRYWEMKKNGLILYGGDIRNLIKDFSQEEIPLSESYRYLNNCLTTLIRLYGTNDKLPFWYFSNRIWCYFADSLLLLKQQLEPTYILRAKKFSEIYKKEFPDLYQLVPDLADQVQKSTIVKLDPTSNIDLTDKELMFFWQKTKKTGLILIDFYLKNWIKEKNLYQNLNKLSTFYFRPYIENSLPYGKKLFPFYKLLCQLFLNLKYIFRLWKQNKKIFLPKNPFIAIDIKLWQLMPQVLNNLENLNSENAKRISLQIPFFNNKNLNLQSKYLLAFKEAEKTRDIHQEIRLLRKVLSIFKKNKQKH